MIGIGYHTDAFNTRNWNFEQCLKWAQQHEMNFIECAAIDGVYMLHSLGYWPHIALYEDPVLLRRKMDRYGVQLSEIDAAFPLSIPEGLTLGVEYVLHTIRWAKMAGCPRIDTTDDKDKPAGASDKEILAHLKRVYGMILPVAEAHGIRAARPQSVEHGLRCGAPRVALFPARRDPGRPDLADHPHAQRPPRPLSSSCSSMIVSENRFPSRIWSGTCFFWIMLHECAASAVIAAIN